MNSMRRLNTKKIYIKKYRSCKIKTVSLIKEIRVKNPIFQNIFSWLPLKK